MGPMGSNVLRHVLCPLITYQEGEMAHTHEFDCIVCGAHFDSERDLDRHNRDRHAPSAAKVEQALQAAEPVGNEYARREVDEDIGPMGG